MSWYSVIYTKARHFRAASPILGALVQWSFYVCVLIELLIVAFTTFIYFGITTQLIQSDIQASMYMVIYGLLTMMAFWAYARVLFATPLRIPKEYEMDEATDAKLRAVTPFNAHGRALLDSCNELQIETQRKIMDDFALSRGISFVEVDAHGRLRYCYECRVLKPDRAHHCSSCGFCATRFDHHCPYLNSCVAHHNYKFFVLFLLYLEVWIIWSVIGGAQGIVCYFLDYSPFDRLEMILPLTFWFLVQLLASIWPLGELLRYHWLLISLNETTCEQAKIPKIRGDPGANYDIGRWKNIEIVMGWGLWLFPVRTTTSDGLHHPVNYSALPPGGDSSTYRVTVAEAETPSHLDEVSASSTTPIP